MIESEEKKEEGVGGHCIAEAGKEKGVFLLIVVYCCIETIKSSVGGESNVRLTRVVGHQVTMNTGERMGIMAKKR